MTWAIVRRSCRLFLLLFNPVISRLGWLSSFPFLGLARLRLFLFFLLTWNVELVDVLDTLVYLHFFLVARILNVVFILDVELASLQVDVVNIEVVLVQLHV